MTAFPKVAGVCSRDEPAVSPLPELFTLPGSFPFGVDLQTQIDATTEQLEREVSRYTAEDLAGLRADGIVAGHERKLAGLRERLKTLFQLRDDRARAEAHERSWQRRWDAAANGALARAKYLFALELLAEPTERVLTNPRASAEQLRECYLHELENVRFGSPSEQPRPRLIAEARERLARLEQRIAACERSSPDA
jgi:hypothetical protein